MELSKEQEQIINAPIDKNIRIIASAGSGKTTTLIQRILYLIKNHNLHLHEIILTTFTKDAAEVMKDKIKKNIHLFYNFMCGTIDSIARKILHINKILDEI
jgi:DNA helicase-2/ATP-dependent DNA helicase PcrA